MVVFLYLEKYRTTGFGALANRHVTPESRVQLQKSLIRSHAAGLGNLSYKLRAFLLLPTHRYSKIGDLGLVRSVPQGLS